MDILKNIHYNIQSNALSDCEAIIMFGKILDFNNPVLRFLSHVFDIAVLNILWLIFSLPVVTMGAATTAVYAVCFQILQDKSSGVLKPFWKSFRMNLKQATVIWLILLAILAVLGVDLWYFLFSQTFIAGILQAIICGILILLLLDALLITIYAFTLLSLFENTVKETLRNAILLILRNPMRSLGALAVDASMLALAFYAPLSGISLLAVGMILLGIALTFFLNCLILMRVFKPYLPKEEEIVE